MKTAKTLAFALSALALATSVYAEQAQEASAYSVVLHSLSYHSSGDQRGLNEVNTGLGLKYDLRPDVAFQVGFYKNSHYRNTTYGFVQYTPLTLGAVNVGVFAGRVTGYTYLKYGAGALVSVPLGYGSSAVIRVLPGKKPPVISIELAIKF